MVTVLLADDHAIVRDGLQALLEAEPDIHVVGTAATGSEAVQNASRLAPDVVVMDISMPSLNGIEAARQLREVAPECRVVILSVHSSSEHVYHALRAGVHGYMLKESAGVELVEAVRTVARGRRYLSAKIAGTVADAYVQFREVAESDSPLERLSHREREILSLVVEGRTSAEISGLLFLSPKTVETYRSRLMQKLGIHDVPGLVKFAIQHGLTSLD